MSLICEIIFVYGSNMSQKDEYVEPLMIHKAHGTQTTVKTINWRVEIRNFIDGAKDCCNLNCKKYNNKRFSPFSCLTISLRVFFGCHKY
jgi:hypothetical protein